MYKIWNIAKPQEKLQNKLKKDLGISKILTQLLINRNITDSSIAEQFLNPKLSGLLASDSLPDMGTACSRIKRAVKNKEKIMIFGDYDVDGLTSTALLKSILKKLGLRVIHYLPHRINEGYGLSKQAIKQAKEENVSLVITVDCGMSNYSEIEELNRLNIDVIITDHHQPLGGKLPPAFAVINPKRQDSRYNYKDLAAVAVAYKFAQRITSKFLEEELDLVCLGTIADVVPLNGENRIIVKEGLSRISQTKRAGLLALIEQAKIKQNLINSTAISYILAPRINASGRLDSADISLRLLLSESSQEAEQLARQVSSLNSQRQQIGDKILREAQDLIDKEINFKEHKVIVLAKPGWHQGVLGIVASRIKDTYHRPTVIISINEHLCKGSARSVNNFHILEALLECNDVLEKFGGHQRAAGLSIVKNNIEAFKDRLNRIAQQRLTLEDLYPQLDMDMELGLADLDQELLDELKMLEPFGEANPEPVFYSRNLSLKSELEIIGRNGLRFYVTDGRFTYKAVGFNIADFKTGLENSKRFDLAYTLQVDKWYDSHNIILKIKDIRLF